MKCDIKRHVNKCTHYQQFKASSLTPTRLLQSLSISHLMLDGIFIDFVEGLHKSHEIDAVLVTVDCFRKYAHFVGLKHPFSTKDVTDKFVREKCNSTSYHCQSSPIRVASS